MTHLHWFFKILDAIITAPLRPNQSTISLLQTMLNLHISHYDRIGAWANLLTLMWPSFTAWVTQRLLVTKYLPMPGARIQILAYGTGSTVYKLESCDQPGVCMILKVYRRSLGQPAATAYRMVSEFQAKHAQLVEWFNDPFEVVIPSHFLVLRGPLLGATCMGVVQEYVSGKKYDLFIDFSIEQILHYAALDVRLRAQLLDFANRQIKVINESGCCFDMLGKENVMVVDINGQLDLKIVDNNYFDIETLNRLFPSRLQRLRERMDHLNQVRLALINHEGSILPSNNLPAAAL